MRRRDIPIGGNPVQVEIEELWEELRRTKQALGASVLPEGFTWSQDGDTLVVVSPSGTRTPIT